MHPAQKKSLWRSLRLASIGGAFGALQGFVSLYLPQHVAWILWGACIGAAVVWAVYLIWDIRRLERNYCAMTAEMLRVMSESQPHLEAMMRAMFGDEEPPRPPRESIQ
jgi:hypothetical protein